MDWGPSWITCHIVCDGNIIYIAESSLLVDNGSSLCIIQRVSYIKRFFFSFLTNKGFNRFFCFLRFTFTAYTFFLIFKTYESRSRYKDCHITDEFIPFAKTVLCVTQIKGLPVAIDLRTVWLPYSVSWKRNSSCLYFKSSKNQFEIGWLKIFTCHVHWSRKCSESWKGYEIEKRGKTSNMGSSILVWLFNR